MKLLYRVNRWLPFSFLPIARIQYAGSTCTLRKDGWVVVADGSNKDMLPLTSCSPTLIAAFRAELA
ncbi:hypothetical protein CXG50_12010 [Pseudomonas plecoglossicida]|nr:hypothetical protein CX682_14610 [Pseudomonas sp. FFUP_PS_41]PLU99868.1 hypothetical protein CXG52_06475 [Pseudomonas plecoglossicida]PLV09128.1 hypothetical protein CXG50_12010 [Pseudomonas plecoglossicida]